MGSDENEKDKRGHLFPGGLGRVTGAVEKARAKGFEKGFETLETLTGHAVLKKNSNKDRSDASADEPRNTAVKDKSEAKNVPAAGVKFTGSTKPVPKKDSLMTSSTTHTTQRSSSDPGTDDRGEIDDDESGDNGIVFHTSNDYKFGAVYWRHGFSLPENGRMLLSGHTLSFKGMRGTRLSFDLGNVDIRKASRMGGLVHDVFFVSTVKSKNSNASAAEAEEEAKFLFSTVLKDRKKVLDKIQSAMANVKLCKEEEEFDANSRRGGARDANKKKFRMPPDPTLQKMKTIAERKLKGVNLQDYWEVAWSEGHNDKKPMYGRFLEKQTKNNVVVGLWETGNYEGEWCGETYMEERIVTFDFLKQTIGQTLVKVKHTQRYRRKDNDQCIVQIKMEMEGFPYADCFVVEVRHVASRVGENDLSIQIGMHVRFLKSCMFEGKIRTNTGAETTKAQLALLEMILEGCASCAKLEGSAEEGEDEDEDETLENALIAGAPKAMARHPIELPDPVFKVLRFIMMAFVTIFRTCLWPYIQPELFDPFPPSSVEEALQSTRARMKLLEEISLKSASERRRNDISREIALIGKSIDRIEKMSTKSNHS